MPKRNKNDIPILKHNVNEKSFSPSKPIKFEPKNENQRLAWEAIDNNPITFLNGSAGTGKTFIAVTKALSLIEKGSHKKIILISPATVPEEEELGFLSGDMKQKISPLILPMTTLIENIIGKERMEGMMEDDMLIGYSLAHIRGLNYYNDTIVLIDEYQCAKAKTLRMLMSRIWDKTKLIIMGDVNQISLTDSFDSAAHSIDRYRNKEQIAFIDFKKSDIVRSNICKIVDSCWDDEENEEKIYTTNKY